MHRVSRMGQARHSEQSGTQENGRHYKRVTDTVAEVAVRFEKIFFRGSG